jgi:hypothetical protein
MMKRCDMEKDDKYKVTYSFSVEYENVNLPDEPNHSLTVLSFDGTDAHIDLIVNQFTTFIRAAGYEWVDRLEVVKKCLT